MKALSNSDKGNAYGQRPLVIKPPVAFPYLKIGITKFWLRKALLIVLMAIISCKPDIRSSPLNRPIQPFNILTSTPAQLPQPAPGTSIISGILKIENTDQPMVGVELYLAQHIGVTPDTPIYKLDLESAPYAITGDNGRFIFEDVPPGRYAIVIWIPFNSFLVRNPTTGSELLIDVEPNRIYDIGTLYERHPWEDPYISDKD
jgi:hypothetical protein